MSTLITVLTKSLTWLEQQHKGKEHGVSLKMHCLPPSGEEKRSIICRRRKGHILPWEWAQSHAISLIWKDLVIMLLRVVLNKQKRRKLIKYGDNLGICSQKPMTKNLLLKWHCSASCPSVHGVQYRASVTSPACLLKSLRDFTLRKLFLYI